MKFKKYYLVFLIFLFLNSNDLYSKIYEDLLWETELATATLRGPLVIASQRAKMTGTSKTMLFELGANVIRLTNDLVSLYNSYKKDDEKWFNYTSPMIWAVQDLSSIIFNFKSIFVNRNTQSEISDEEEGSEGFEEYSDKEFSELERKLIIYVLPLAEWAASVGRAVDSCYISDDSWTKDVVRWASNIVISGSRILSELIKAESGSLERKLVITKSVVCACVILTDVLKGDFFHNVPETTGQDSSIGNSGKKVEEVPTEMKVGGDQQPEDSELPHPVHQQEESVVVPCEISIFDMPWEDRDQVVGSLQANESHVEHGGGGENEEKHVVYSSRRRQQNKHKVANLLFGSRQDKVGSRQSQSQDKEMMNHSK